MEKQEEFDPIEMTALFDSVIKMSAVGLEKGMEPKEVVKYTMDVFKEFTSEMERIAKLHEGKD